MYKLSNRGKYTLVEGEDLPFEEDPEEGRTEPDSLTRHPAEAAPGTDPPAELAGINSSYRPGAKPPAATSPAKIEMWDTLFPQDIQAFASMCRSGQVELIAEDSVYHRKSGILDAHFYLVSPPVSTGENKGEERP